MFPQKAKKQQKKTDEELRSIRINNLNSRGSTSLVEDSRDTLKDSDSIGSKDGVDNNIQRMTYNYKEILHINIWTGTYQESNTTTSEIISTTTPMSTWVLNGKFYLNFVTRLTLNKKSIIKFT